MMSLSPRRQTDATLTRRLSFRSLQMQRALTQGAFLLLFVLAPVFDLFRYDLDAGHAWILGQAWRLDLAALAHADAGRDVAALRLLTLLILPVVGAAVLFLVAARRWGRVYCGWLCPHFSVVETINRLMRRASGRHSVWDRHPVPQRVDTAGRRWRLLPDGRRETIDMRWWLLVVPVAMTCAGLWALVLLTYLRPPVAVYAGVLHGALSRGEVLFLTVATVILSLDFLFARHLFCRYGCAVGMFQSLAWMSNPRASMVRFARERARDCAACPALLGAGQTACEDACPMRLNPRAPKRRMFACTQCAQCISACADIQQKHRSEPVLARVHGDAARLASRRDEPRQTAP